MPKKTSPHILNTSANLLGFCLFVITSLHLASNTEMHVIDDLTAVTAILLTFSSLFSFISIKTDTERYERVLENIADVIFILALFLILATILLIAFEITVES